MKGSSLFYWVRLSALFMLGYTIWVLSFILVNKPVEYNSWISFTNHTLFQLSTTFVAFCFSSFIYRLVDYWYRLLYSKNSWISSSIFSQICRPYKKWIYIFVCSFRRINCYHYFIYHLELNFEYLNSSNISTLEFDVLVIGGGGSGMRTSLELAKSGLKTAVVSKVFPTRSHTVSAQGGITCAIASADPQDDWRWHMYDTVQRIRLHWRSRCNRVYVF